MRIMNLYKLLKSGKTKCDALIKRNVIFSCKTKCNKISTFLRKSLFYMVQKRGCVKMQIYNLTTFNL